MLNRKLQRKEYRGKRMFDCLCRIFRSELLRVSAEYVILHESDSIDTQKLRDRLMRSLFHFVFSDEELTNEFLCKGRFVSLDTALASQLLFESLTSFWFHSETQKERGFLKSYYRKYFSRLASVEAGAETVSAAAFRYADRTDHAVRYGLLRKIINGEAEVGDSVLDILYPPFGESKMPYKIDTEDLPPFFRRLVERRGGDIVLLNADPESPGFVLAFTEALPYTCNEHRSEFVSRLISLYGKERLAA